MRQERLRVNDNKSSEALLYLGASARPVWPLPASTRAGFGRTGADGGGGNGGVGRWFLAVWQGVVNALHSARVSRGIWSRQRAWEERGGGEESGWGMVIKLI